MATLAASVLTACNSSEYDVVDKGRPRPRLPTALADRRIPSPMTGQWRQAMPSASAAHRAARQAPTYGSFSSQDGKARAGHPKRRWRKLPGSAGCRAVVLSFRNNGSFEATDGTAAATGDMTADWRRLPGTLPKQVAMYLPQKLMLQKPRPARSSSSRRSSSPGCCPSRPLREGRRSA